MIVLFAPVTHCQHHDFRRTDDLVQRDIPGPSERNDQFPLSWVAGRFAEAEGRDRQPVLRRRSYRVDRSLGAIKVLGRLGAVDQELEVALQVSLGRRRQFDGSSSTKLLAPGVELDLKTFQDGLDGR